MGLRTISSVLLGTLFFFVPAVQAQVSEAEAHILSAFMTSADPGVFADVVAVGPQLRKDVGAEPESNELYQAIATLTAGRALRVQFPSPAESARYRTIPGANPTDPFVALETGDMRFIFQYAPKQKRVGFVEQVSGDPLPRLAQRKRPPAPKQPAVAAAPRPRPPVVETPIDPSTPRGECVVKPIMSQLDLYNCSAPTAPAAPVDLPPPAAVAAAKPAVPAGPRKRGECVIKPVMTDDDLFNCVGVTDSTPPVFPVAAAVLHAFIPASPSSLARPECVIRPVMTDEELRRCASDARSAPSSPPAAAPTPVATQTPEPAAPKPPAECVIKPVMTDEELRICAALAKSTPSLPPVAAVAVQGPAAAAPVPAAAKPPPDCIIKPVMSDDDLRACASVPRSGGLLLIPVAASTPAAAPAPAAPKPAPECVIKPVMSDEELRACGSRR